MPRAQPVRLDSARAAALAVATGLLYAVAQPSWGAWPLSVVCLVPLLRAQVGRGARARAGLGWLAGTAMTLAAEMLTVSVGASAFFGVPTWQGGVIALALGQLFGGGSFALAAVLAGDPARSGSGTGSAVLRVGMAWAGMELVRSTIFSGMPWLLLAYSLAPVPALIQSASWGGALLVSGWLAAANAAVLRTVAGPGRMGGVRACTALALLVAGSAGWALAGPPAPNAPGTVQPALAGSPASPAARRVLLVQGNIPNAWRGNLGRIGDALSRLVELTRSAPDVDLAVWPENAVSFLLPVNADLVRKLMRPLGDSPHYLLLGTPRVASGSTTRLYNAAVLFGPEREIAGYYDKIHRLPFAEYVPGALRALGIRGGHMQAGSEPVVLSAGGLELGPLICYEIIFSELARAQVRAGANVLVNQSNDAWFGTTGAIEQHLAAAIFRAVETRRPVLRATNTGVTAAIDAWGRVTAKLPPNRPGALAVDVVPRTDSSAYVRAGEVAGATALAGSALLALLELPALHGPRAASRQSRKRR